MIDPVQIGRHQLFKGDCAVVLAQLPDASVDAIVTDPPYGLSFMGQKWDYDVPGVAVWQHAMRVLKPGGHLLSFFGTRTYHRGVIPIEDAGFEIRDQIGWVYGSGFPKSLDVSKAIDKAAGVDREIVAPPPYTRGKAGQQYSETRKVSYDYQPLPITAPATDDAKRWNGWGTALKPAWEPIVVARKPLIGTVVQNVLAHGTGAINVDGCRVELNGDYKCGANGRPSQTGLGDNYDAAAANQHSEIGRWPANIVHDGSREVVSQFPHVVSGAMRHEVEGYSGESNTNLIRGRSGPSNQHGGSGSAARFFYCAKATRKERGRMNKHPTVKPVKLMRWLVRLVTPPGGIVCDPFLGSGTTAIACQREGFLCLGIESDAQPDAFDTSVARLTREVARGRQQSLF